MDGTDYWGTMRANYKIRSCEVDEVYPAERSSGEGWNWKFYFHPEYHLYVRAIAGKWVYHGTPDELSSIAFDLRGAIAAGLSSQLKYRPTLNDPQGRFHDILPPLCIYADLDCQQELRRYLLQRSVAPIYWQSNEATAKLHGRG